MGPSPESLADAFCTSCSSGCSSTLVTHGLGAQAMLEYMSWGKSAGGGGGHHLC